MYLSRCSFLAKKTRKRGWKLDANNFALPSLFCLASSLFSKLQGDDESANKFCDFCVFDKALDSLRKWSSEEPSFETNTQAIKVFQQIYDCVKERPGNWQKYFETQKPGNSGTLVFFSLFFSALIYIVKILLEIKDILLLLTNAAW